MPSVAAGPGAPTVLNVDHRGAMGNGTTNDYDPIQAHLDTAAAVGAACTEIHFTAGKTYLLDTVGGGGLKLTRNGNLNDATVPTRGWVKLVGNGCKIKLTANVPRFLDLNRISSFDIFRYLWVEGFDIDAGNIGGAATVNSHVVIGCTQDANSDRHLDIRDIVIKDIRATNIKTDQVNLNTSINHRRGICFDVRHANNAQQQTRIKDVLIEDVTIGDGVTGGGNTGFAFAGSNDVVSADPAVLATNVYIDNLSLIRCSHDRGLVPTAFVAANNFHVGSYALGGKVTLTDLYARGGGDLCYELNNITECTVTRCTADDCMTVGFLANNKRVPEDLEAQKYVFDRCRHRRIGNVQTGSIGFAQGNGGTRLGTVELRSCSYFARQNPDFTQSGAAITCAYVDGAQTVDHLILEDFEATLPGISGAADAAGFPAAVLIDDTLSKLTIRGLKLKYAGSFSSGTLQARLVYLNSTGTVLDIEDVDIDYNITGGGTVVGLYLGAGTSTPSGVCTQSGRIARVRISQLVGSTAASTTGILVASSVTLTIDRSLTIEDCDFKNLPAGATDIVVGDNTNKAKTFFYRNKWRTFPVAASSPADPGSATAYQNLDGYAEYITLSGGSVSQIAIAPDGSTFVNTGATSGTFYLDNAAAIKVTHTGAPTWTKVPVK